MGLSNDDRGWVMTALSGLACIFGASFICVDLIVRLFPGKRNWSIKNSDTFLSISLSLSFGVMLFSALYSMLPSAKNSLKDGGLSSSESSWVMIACFIGGVVGIQIVSRVMHHYVPHHAVDCEHTHEDDEEAHKEGVDSHEAEHEHDHRHEHARPNVPARSRVAVPETTQLTPSHLHSDNTASDPIASARQPTSDRPALPKQLSMTFAKLTSGKDPSCTCDGPCFGYSDPCSTECFKNVNARGGFKAPKPTMGLQRPSAIKNATATESTPLLHDISEESLTRPHTRAVAEGTDIHPSDSDPDRGQSSASSTTAVTAVTANGSPELHKPHSHQTDTSLHASHNDDSHAESHHHHVPTNAFLSIGLQTSIAIALHKLPEGFITYATNHANPKLGVSVFLALFIHNITEGFAMALPLYLAINNRIKAMLVSFVLGGLSQPLGAGVAALWFKLAGRSGWQPNEIGYGAMFAVTAGILASVALQLFAESLDLTHSKHLCMIGAFIGMAILGISSALTV